MGLIFNDNAELLNYNFPFKLTSIVAVSLANFGDRVTVFVTSVGTLTTLPWILNFFPLGVCISLWKEIFGANNLNSFQLKKKKKKTQAFSRSTMPFTMAQGRTL